MLSRFQLHKYQLEIVDYIKNKPKCGLFVEMGLGKTISTLTALADLKEEEEIKKVLVIAPKRVAESVWEQEAANWRHTQHLQTSRILVYS